MSQWVERHRELPSETSAEPGRLDISRAEYQRAWLDAASNEETRQITIMACSQSGKSEFELSVVAWYMGEDPCPILVVLPTQADAEAYSKERLAPMIAHCAPLRGKVSEARTRDGDNTLTSKRFPGGRVSLTASHSPAGLCARPIRVILFDEVDRYPPSAGTEGDPVDLGTKRTTTFWNRLVVRISSPTTAGESRIDKSFREGTRELYHVPCPHCGHFQPLVWAQLRWTSMTLPSGRHWFDAESVRYHCAECDCPIDEASKTAAVRGGRWVAEHPERGPEHRSFHISALYSPWVTFVELVEEWYHAQDDTERLKTFTNTRLAETWEEHGEKLDTVPLYERREFYRSKLELPTGVAVITAAVDVQDDRLEVEVKGWGRGRESWSLEYFTLQGDTSILRSDSRPSVWDDLDQILTTRRYPHPSKAWLRIGAVCVDSGGHRTTTVYEFCSARTARRVWAIKGASTTGLPIWPGRATKANAAGCPLYTIGTDTAKDLIHADLAKVIPGPGYVHHPDYPLDYFEQLTSEQRVVRKRSGQQYTAWERIGGRRNEALDLHVYNLAAIEGLHVDLDVIADQLAIPRCNEAAVTEIVDAQPMVRTQRKAAKRRFVGSRTMRVRRR